VKKDFIGILKLIKVKDDLLKRYYVEDMYYVAESQSEKKKKDIY
jgi:hypothetical protein